MTDQRIAELLELCEKATPGPWERRERHYRDVRIRCSKETDAEIASMSNWNGEYEAEQRVNGEFIAAARTALPEALRALVEAKKKYSVLLERNHALEAANALEQQERWISELDGARKALRDMLDLVNELKENLRLMCQLNTLTGAENTNVIVKCYEFWDAPALAREAKARAALGEGPNPAAGKEGKGQ